MIKKLNLDTVKSFFLLHGEKVALGTCVGLALLIGVKAFLRAMNANCDNTGRPLVSVMDEHTSRVRHEIAAAKPYMLSENQEKQLVPGQYGWSPRESSYSQTPFLPQMDEPSNKRVNPTPLPLRRDPKYFQLDYVRGLMLVRDYDPDKETLTGLKGGAAPAGGGGGGGVEGVGMPKFGGGGGGPAGSLPPPMQVGRPSRMVIGSGVFPMKEQIEMFRKALKATTQKELFDSPNREDLPRTLGFNLVRYEIQRDGNPAGAPVMLLNFDPKTSKWTIAESVQKMLRDAIYDERTPERLEPWIFSGLTMPMPRLAHGGYPRPYLEGIEIGAWDEDEKRVDVAMKPPAKKDGKIITVPGKKVPPVRPMGAPPEGMAEHGASGADGEIVIIRAKEVKASDVNLANRLFIPRNRTLLDVLNVYHVLGATPPKVGGAPKQYNPGMPGAPADNRYNHAWDTRIPEIEGRDPEKKPGPGGEDPGGEPPGGTEGPPDWNRDAILRFIDPDVQPGKTYQYAIQVRIANPNFGKLKSVLYKGLADIPELALDPNSSWVLTPPISIPYEYYLYCVDQRLLDDWAAPEKADPKDKGILKDAVSFQVHQWVKRKSKKDDSRVEFVIGDWVIAERLIVRRGEHIGLGASVQVPIWNKMRNGFYMPELARDPNPKEKKPRPGIEVDLKPTFPDDASGKEREYDPPVLVDFVGGKKVRPGTTIVEEECAVDALILTIDGRLEVLNSRMDSDLANPAARERQSRIVAGRRRMEAPTPTPADKKGPMAGGGG